MESPAWWSRSSRALLAGVLCAACSAPSPQRSPAGEAFPEVAVAGPEGEALLLPQAAGGEPAVVLLALERRAQFDLDRWLLGLQQLGVDAPVFQLAAAGGLRPTDRSGWLSAEGAAAEALRAATGTAAPQNVRALVLDGEGRVQWSSAVGYSAARVRAAAGMVDSLRAEAALAAGRQPDSRTSTAPGSATDSAPEAAVAAARAAGAGHPLVGRAFPEVRGSSLAGTEVALPKELAGAPAVLLVGYEQETQLDIDRWILGLLDAGVTARLLEVPAIPSFFASFASGFIDDGMRGGIPEEDWGLVVTLYGGAAKPLATFTGREGGRPTRVLLLDAAGQVAWFDDAGYAPAKARAVAEVAAALGR